MQVGETSDITQWPLIVIGKWHEALRHLLQNGAAVYALRPAARRCARSDV
jgi:hypothetical protein